jgi:hypothetical protein
VTARPINIFSVVPAKEAVNLSPLRPHPEEPERSEGVSKDGHEFEPVAMVRDGALRAPPHHEAERVELAKINKFTGSFAGTTSIERNLKHSRRSSALD